jgi:hypothetical protein
MQVGKLSSLQVLEEVLEEDNPLAMAVCNRV